MATTFHLFPLLPSELRLKIWSCTFPPGRILEITQTPRNRWVSAPSSRSPNPTFACHEPLAEFLKSWTRFLPYTSSGHSYINPVLDTVYIGAMPESYSAFDYEALEAFPLINQIRSLAVEIREWSKGENDVAVWQNEDENDSEDEEMEPAPENWDAQFLRRFGALERFVVADYDFDYHCLERREGRMPGELEFVQPTQQGDNEMWPAYAARLETAREKGEVSVKAELREVMRGGILMRINE